MSRMTSAANSQDFGQVVARLRAAGCVYAEDEATLLVAAAEGDDRRLERLITARVAGQPLEQLLGWVAFAGLRIAVGPDVFVPRVRTELLAEQARARLGGDPVVVELCCGVAAVSAVLQRSGPARELYAVDIDPAAVGYARRNLSEPAVVLVGDLYDPLPTTLRGHVDVIAANAPYVPTAAIALMPPEARDHEPASALDGGPDGTDILARVIAGAPEWLAPGGLVLVEVGRAQVATVTNALRDRGLTPRVLADEELGALIVTGRR